LVSYSQNSFKVTYGILFQGEFLSEKAKQNTDLAEGLNGIENYMSKYEFTLNYNNGKAIYEVIPVLNINNEYTLSEQTAMIFIDFEKKFYNDVDSVATIVNQNIDNKKYNVISSQKYDNWNLTTESKIIDNYTCYKATSKIRNVNIEAWYCPEIPVSLGPNEFKGLPGLILELSRGKLKYITKSITLDSKEHIELPKGKLITEDEFNKILDNSSNNIFKKKIN
jgi:GLPGLI family protein